MAEDDRVLDDEHPQDLKGCFLFIFRAGGCILYTTITMFLAMIAAAMISLLFFR